jgi:hypothetical protein
MSPEGTGSGRAVASSAGSPPAEVEVGPIGDEIEFCRLHMQITTIGLDIAKYVFQVHGIDARPRKSSSGSDFKRL